MEMRHRDIVRLGVEMWEAGETGTPILILGPPGVGKTAVAGTIAAEMGRRRNVGWSFAGPRAVAGSALLGVWDTTSRLAEDIQGMPRVSPEGFTTYAPLDDFWQFCQDGAFGVFCLDDIAASTTSVQVASRKILLDRRAGTHVLSDGVLVMATGNRREDKAAASTLPSQFLNACLIVSVRVDYQEWAEWYAGLGAEHANPAIAGFLAWQPGELATTPDKRDLQTGAFATPRQWEKLGRLMKIAKATDTLYPVAAGLVGEAAATKFVAFMRTRSELVNPREVLMNPREVLPNPGAVLNAVDKRHALISGMAEVAAAEMINEPEATATKEKQIAHLRRFCVALAWATSDCRDFTIVGFDAIKTLTKPHMVGKKQSVEYLIADATRPDGVQDPWAKEQLSAMRDFLRRALTGGR